jgi:transposase
MIIGVNGIVGYKILDNNCKKQDFTTFIEQIQLPSGSTILMDNLRAHHSKEVLAAGEKKGFVFLFTPPYSPRCNPIEKVFGMLKPSYRKRCTSLVTHEKEDFKNVFIQTINSYQTVSFESTFVNTLLFTQETARKIKDDASFKFIGYDVPSFISLFPDLK